MGKLVDKIEISVCVSDLNKAKLWKSQDGKLNANISVVLMKAEDNYGKDFSVSESKNKQEREAKVETVYLGKGKSWVWERDNNAQPATTNSTDFQTDAEDDLPF